MKFVCQPAALRGSARIPGSKSHTIRAVTIAAMAHGQSTILDPLISADALSAVKAVRALGARVDTACDTRWLIDGCAGLPRPCCSEIDVGNSGTTLLVVLALASLLRDGQLVLTGDAQIQRRPAGPLLDALNALGARVSSERGNGCAPFTVEGGLRGGSCTLRAITSQYLTSLLIATPLADGDSTITLLELNEKPYVQMTLDWLAMQNISLSHDGMQQFRVKGGQAFRPFVRTIPGDFSSATFFLAAGALPGNATICVGLDMEDSQADKKVVEFLRQFGARVTVSGNSIEVQADRLQGTELDLNETPDALPMLAALACFAEGETRFRNVAHARIKETDRIAVMAQELGRMGADIRELPDGLVIRGSELRGTDVDGHGDHRVVMALAIAASAARGTTEIRGSEAASITFPSFAEIYASLGGSIVVMQ